MTLADALSWLVGLSALIGIVTNVRHLGFRPRGWLFVQASLLVLVVLGVVLQTAGFAYAACIAWTLFVLGPMAARRREHERLRQFDFDGAERWARVAAWLHPFDGGSSQVTFVRAQGEAFHGRLEQARALFAELERSSRLHEVARFERLRLDRDWPAIVAEVERRGAKPLDPWHVMPYFRALGETGDITGLVRAYAKLPLPLRRVGVAQLLVVAFSGRPDLVHALFEGPLARDPLPVRDYWLAVAEQASGDGESARRRFEMLAGGGLLAEQAKQRLLTPVPVAEQSALAPDARQALVDLAREIREARSLPRAASRRPVATVALIGVLALVFVIGVLQGKNDTETLVRMGALVLPPERAGGGAAWRVVTAGFLHVNGTHLFMNLLGLWVIGRMVEQLAGPIRMLIAFLGSSIGAYTTGLFFMRADMNHPAIALGASAGLLGLVGALAGFAATGYFLRKNRLLAQQLRGIAFIVGIQLVFDHFHPSVSSFLHLAGAAWGAALALPYALHYFRRTKAFAPIAGP